LKSTLAVKNDKGKVLAKYKDNELLKRVIYLAHSPRIKFYIKQIPEYVKDDFELNMPLEQALVTLENIYSEK
jgi:NADPH-dependent curcumin reductase CurA